jgi:transcriptional regulator with XRE-family HTH domain
LTQDEWVAAFGRRVKDARAARGFRSSLDLANAIGSDAVSHNVLRNIESGRKAELSIVQMLEIAMALEISPLALIVDFSRPFQPIDIQGLGPVFSRMSALEFDRWFTASGGSEADRDQASRPIEQRRLVISRRLEESSWMQSMRRESIQKAVHDKAKYDAPQFFGHLRAANWEIDDSIDALLTLAAEQAMDLRKTSGRGDTPANEDSFPAYLGARIRRLRKEAGFRSAAELAAEIGNPHVSESVIRNLESGRKTDASLAQVLEIAMAIGISPIVLLFDFSAPFLPSRIPGMGPLFERRSTHELDLWMSAPSDPLRFASEEYRPSPLEVQRMHVARGIEPWIRLRDEPAAVDGAASEELQRTQRASQLFAQVTLEWMLRDAEVLGIDVPPSQPAQAAPTRLRDRFRRRREK